MIRRVIITLGFLFSLAGAAMAADGDGAYFKPAEGYVFPALTPIMQLAGTTDNNGNLNISNTLLGSGATPLTPIGNLPGRTDSSGNLLVNCQAGCGATMTALTTQISWTTGLGAINHVQGPTDQIFTVIAGGGRQLDLKGGSNLGVSIGSGGGLFTTSAIGGDKGQGTVNIVGTNNLFFDGLAREFFVTADFTTASATLVTATGLSWTMPASKADNVPFRCVLSYSQATAAAANLFGVITGGTAPTNLQASGLVSTSATAHSEGTATITTATSTTVVTATPSAITTVWRAELEGFLEAPNNASPTTIAIGVATGNVSDSLTIKRGSFCIVN